MNAHKMEEAVRSENLQRVQELIRSGADVNIRCKFSSNHNPLLIEAISHSHKDIALALLEAGADVHAKNDKEWTALHLACKKSLNEVAQALIDRGSRLDDLVWKQCTPLWFADGSTAMCLLRAGASCKGLSKEKKEKLFVHACSVGDVLAVSFLLNNGCRVSTLSREEQEKLLRCACTEGNLLVAGALFKDGCSVVTLSREEQEQLLRCACRERNIFVARTLLNSRCSASKLAHTEVVQLLNHLPKEEQEGLLRGACSEGDMVVFEALIAAGCSVNCVSSTGGTPLMNAAHNGHPEILKKLILAGANLEIQDELIGTAFHYAASRNHIQCGVLLAEGGASVRTKNKLSQTPLDMAKANFREAIQQALSFTTRKAICIIGNAEGGKSTLIASLQAESTRFLGSFVNRFRRMDDSRKRTSGIETVSHRSQKYGEVLFFDFAGQDDYHGPHQMFMESLLSKPGVSMTLLLVIKVTECEEAILHQLHRWLTPVALMSIAGSPAHVIIIGSFLDKVKSKQEAIGKLSKCIEETRCDLEELPLRFVGTCFLNCRQPQSEGIDQLCSYLQEVPVEEFRATRTRYSLAWVLLQIRSFLKTQALQLQEFSAWMEDNKANLPRTIPVPEEVCQDLSAAGHALYLPNREDPPKGWLVLDLPSILHDVYGTLFSRSQKIVNKFGLLHCRALAELFPRMHLAMVQQLLISLEFCIPVDPLVLMVEMSKLTQSDVTSGWLFFPALISTKPSEPNLEILPEQSVHCLCWQLKTSKKHSISARILQTILLRLAAHFVVKQRDKDGVQQHYCNIWWNGIAWQSTVGVNVSVHITKSSVIQVIATSEITNELREYLSDIISDILSTVSRLSPNLSAAAYIVHPPNVATSAEDITSLPPKELFPVEGIQSSIREQKGFVFSLKDEDDWNTMSIADLFGGFTPTLEYTEKITWTQPDLSQPQSPTEPNQPTEGNGMLSDSKVLPATQALLDISSTPDMRDINELVVTTVAANWQRLALRLGVKGCVSEIVSTNYPIDCERACRDMLDRWLRGEKHTGEEERTWSTLLTVLGKVGFMELERSLRREHFIRNSTSLKD